MYATNLGDILYVTTLHALAAVAADADGTALDISDYDGEIAIILVNDAGSQGGGSVDRTLAVKVKECATSGGSYTDATGGGFTSLAVTAGTQKISLNSDELQKFIKINFDISGANSPTYNVTALVVGAKKNPA